MRVDTQRFLKMVEATPGGMLFFDLEASGLRGDYNSIICGSLLSYEADAGDVDTYMVKKVGADKEVVGAIKDRLEEAEMWVTYYGRGFDIKMLNTRLLRWGMDPVERRPHLDLYFLLKANLLTARRSQGHLLSWLGTPEQKMGVSATVWSEANLDKKNLKILADRCASDVEGLRALYTKTKHLVKEVTT